MDATRRDHLLAVYCLGTIDTSASNAGVPELVGVVVPVVTHLWRHNLVLSLLTGTTVALLLTNVALPV